MALEHPAAQTVSLYLAGALPPEGEAAFDAHLDACEACRVKLSEQVRQRYEEEAATRRTAPAEQRLPVEVGAIVLERYRIVRLLGLGGMGFVFEAHHLQLNQRVALKFMRPEFARDGSAVDRFVREARAAVRLVTEHVGRVLDLGSLPDGTPCLIMEYLQGETVEQRLQREGPFAPTVAVDLIRQALFALEEAHGLGIIHRDFKPANLFLSRRSNGTEVLKVLDFGVAKSVHPDIEAGLSSTSQKTILGSPLYMAPEQLTPGAPLTPAVDLWAVGCTLYQLLTGQTPFQSDDLVELMYTVQKTPHPRLSVKAPAAANLEPVIDACLAKSPAQRVSTVAGLRGLLDEARPAVLAKPEAVTALPRSPRRGWVLGLAVVTAVGLALWAWSVSRAEPTSAPPATVTAPTLPVLPAPPVLTPVAAPAPTKAPADAGSAHRAPTRPVPVSKPPDDPLDQRL
jgi:serine/threonine-protein kinase